MASLLSVRDHLMASEHIFEDLPWALLAIGIVLGGLIVLYVVKRLLAFCLLHRRYRRGRYVIVVDSGGARHRYPTSRGSYGSMSHLFLETFFFVGAVIVMWIGAHVAGFNFWTSSLVGVGLGVVATYMFGIGLQNIGAGYFVFLFSKVNEGEYLRILGGGVRAEGEVTEVNANEVILTRLERDGNVTDVRVPHTLVMSSVIERPYAMEYRITKQRG